MNIGDNHHHHHSAFDASDTPTTAATTAAVEMLFDAQTLSELMEIDVAASVATPMSPQCATLSTTTTTTHSNSPSGTSTASSNSNSAAEEEREGENDEEEDGWRRPNGSDSFMDAMLFQDIEALLISHTDSHGLLQLPHQHIPTTPATIAPLSRMHPEGEAMSMDWEMDVAQALEASRMVDVGVDEEDDSMVSELEAEEEPSVAAKEHTREQELLQREVKFLEAQRDFLQFKADTANAALHALEGSQDTTLRQQAEVEKSNLQIVMCQQEMLAELAIQQQKSLRDLELLLMQSPLNHYRMTLMTPMESYIKLSRDPIERRATLLSMRDEKVDAVRQYIEYQARHIDPQREFFYLDTFEQFGKFYTVDFSVSQLNHTTVFEVAETIQDHFVTSNDGISQLLGCVSNREFFDGLEETFLNARIVDRVDIPKKHISDRGFVVQESNAVFYRKKLDDMTVMMSDYVDEDELHPYRKTGRIRKDISVGITLSPHVNADGVSCVIMKRFSFIKHHFANIPPTPDVLQAISTRVILWGQAVRFCIARRRKPKQKSIFLKYSFPRHPSSARAHKPSDDTGVAPTPTEVSADESDTDASDKTSASPASQASPTAMSHVTKQRLS